MRLYIMTEQIIAPTQHIVNTQGKNRPATKHCSGLRAWVLCNLDKVRLVDYRWNQVYLSLMLMYKKLQVLGLDSA